MDIFLEAVKMPSEEVRTFTEKLDNILLHPVFGIPIFFASMLGVFFLIWYLGLPSQDVIDMATTWMSEQIIKPIIFPFPDIIQSFFTQWSMAWGGNGGIFCAFNCNFLFCDGSGGG